MKTGYTKTITACFVGYIVQAIVNNFVPLLFLTFHAQYGIPMTRITMLITLNFGLQLAIDMLSVTFIDRIGYRASMVIAHTFSVLGLVSLTILPDLCANPFAGLLTAVLLYAVGGGLLEVLVSPVVEACPTDNKEAAMSLLHSFYCWGQVAVVLLSTIFFKLFGINNWKILAIFWAVIPFINGLVFLKVPMAALHTEEEQGLNIRGLLRQRVFWVLLLMMLCAGASEQAVSQWASTFAESGLGVSKTIGDLAGPMAFAVLMGSSRAFYGKFGSRIDLNRFMAVSSLLCILSYLCIVFIPNPVFGLIGCGLCGLSVGIMWPGSFSIASASIPNGGTAMFAFLALAGDLGCSGGPTLVGFVSGHFQDNLKTGILAAVIFPLLLLACCFIRPHKKRPETQAL